MKTLILLILTIIGLNSYSQSRLGWSSAEIKKEFSSAEYKLTEAKTTDGTKYLKIKIDRALVAYYFNEKGICTTTLILPDNQGALNWFVQTYNDQFVIINSRNWRMYSDKGECDISLVYTDEAYYFQWTMPD